MLKRLLVSIAVGVCFLGVLFASTTMYHALPELSESDCQALLDGALLSGNTLQGKSISQFFVPDTEASKRAQKATQAENSFSIAAVSYIPYGPVLQDMTNNERSLAVYNAMREISTQEGLTYISHRAGDKPKVLIEKSSYMVDSKNLNKLIPDPVAKVYPKSEKSYVFQRDSSFGGNRYLHTYTNSEREIFVEITNISAVKVFGIFTAIPKEKLSINMATYLLDDGLLLMALTTIEDREPKVSVLGISVDLPSSFLRRITALQQWFVGRLEALE